MTIEIKKEYDILSVIQRVFEQECRLCMTEIKTEFSPCSHNHLDNWMCYRNDGVYRLFRICGKDNNIEILLHHNIEKYWCQYVQALNAAVSRLEKMNIDCTITQIYQFLDDDPTLTKVSVGK